jgi:hypothetical protein
MAEVYYVSLKPSDAVSGGAMVPEGEYEIAQARFELWDYNGTMTTKVPALLVEYKQGQQQPYKQYYSAGSPDSMEPTEDGKRLQAKTPRGLNVSTNCYAFFKSLIDSNFAEAKLADDISVIIGTRVKVVHEEAPEREIGGKKVAKRMIPVIDAILSMPDAKEKAKPAAKSSSTKKANGAEETISGDLKAKAAEVLINVLKTGNGMLHMKEITRGIYNTMPASDEDRSPILNLVVSPPFLKAMEDRGVIFDPDKSTVMYVGD